MLWNRINVTPSPRCAHTLNMLHFNCKQFLVIHGGWDGAYTIFNDYQIFDVEEKQWDSCDVSITPSSQSDLPSRFGHASAAIHKNSKVVVFGGVNSNDDLTDLIVLELEYK